MTELLRDIRAAHEARRIYDRAVERHFIEAHKAVGVDEVQAALRHAKTAATLRMDARYELRDS